MLNIFLMVVLLILCLPNVEKMKKYFMSDDTSEVPPLVPPPPVHILRESSIASLNHFTNSLGSMFYYSGQNTWNYTYMA